MDENLSQEQAVPVAEIDAAKVAAGIMEWSWCYPGAEQVDGPFPTREAAIAAAVADHKEQCSEGTSITIELGHPRHADPASYVPHDMNRMLEAMDEQASDDAFGWCDDEIFEVARADRVTAEADLRARLEEWAAKWVTSDKWTHEACETITVPL